MKILVLIAIIMLYATSGFAQTQIVGETFEAVTPGNIPATDPTGSGEISSASNSFSGSGDGVNRGQFISGSDCPDSGKCARAFMTRLEQAGGFHQIPAFNFNSLGSGITKVYAKFDLLVEQSLEDKAGNLKFIQFTDTAVAAHGQDPNFFFQFYFGPSCGAGCYTVYDYGGGEYYCGNASSNAVVNLPNNAGDNAWHTYEFYIELGTHISTERYDSANDTRFRLWEDSVLIYDDPGIPIRTQDWFYQIQSFAFISHAYDLPADDTDAYLRLDNIEVWINGLPGDPVDPPAPPPELESVTIAQGSIVMDLDMDVTESGDGSDWALTMTHGAVTLSNPNAVADKITYDLSRTVYYQEELIELDYTQPTNGIESLSDDTDLATINNYSGTFLNNSDIRIKPTAGIQIGRIEWKQNVK